MAQAYTAPDWGTGEGISPSNLQSISNTLEGIVQGTDKAIHNIGINGSILLVTYVDGTTETFGISGMKGIVEVTKTSSGNVDTYTMIFTDGTTYSFTVTNGGGGGNADKVELTKAEYDALPDSKLTDGKMYFIKDLEPSALTNIYDDTERIIGSWFDKPLYRKVFTNLDIKVVKDVWTNTDCVINDCDFLTNVWIIFDDKKSTNGFEYRYFNNNIQFQSLGMSLTRNVSIIIVEYTKVGA